MHILLSCVTKTGQIGRHGSRSAQAGSKRESQGEISFRILREALARHRRQLSLRELQRETGVRSQCTVDNIIKGKTRRSSEATVRLLRAWHLRMIREGYEDDTGGTPPEEAKLVAIAYLVQDFPTKEQKKLALELYDKLYECYARTGTIPRWMRLLNKLIAREWP